MPIPADILAVSRPKNTVVICYGKNKDRYGVRERTGCSYSEGRRLPKNGKIIGHIENYEYVPIGQKKHPVPVSQAEIDLKEWGTYTFCSDIASDLLKDLKEVYCEEDAQKIYCISMLRLCQPGIKDYELKETYEESFLSEFMPDVALSKNTVSSFLNNLGKSYSRIVSFMRKRVDAAEGHTKLIDGTLKSDESDVNSLSDYSRKAQLKGSRDISVLYCFDLDEQEPICSKCFPGNMLDSVSYDAFISEFNIKSGLIVGDKGFPSSCANHVFAQNKELHYLNPLKRDSHYIKEYDLYNFEGQLPGHETILYKKVHVEKENKWLYSFRDTATAHKEEYGWLHKTFTGSDEYNHDTYTEDSKEFGTVVLESDLDMEPLKAYLTYESRWEIELVMRYYKQACEFDETREQEDYSVIGSEFCCFLSSVMTYRILNKIEKTGILEEMTYKKFLKILQKAKKVRVEENGEWKLVKMLPSHIVVLQKVGLLPKPEPKKRGRKPKEQV